MDNQTCVIKGPGEYDPDTNGKSVVKILTVDRGTAFGFLEFPGGIQHGIWDADDGKARIPGMPHIKGLFVPPRKRWEGTLHQYKDRVYVGPVRTEPYCGTEISTPFNAREVLPDDPPLPDPKAWKEAKKLYEKWTSGPPSTIECPEWAVMMDYGRALSLLLTESEAG